MGVVLSIVAVAVLAVLIVASLRVQLGARAEEREAAGIRADTNQAHHADAQRRQAEVRAAFAERSGSAPARTDE